MANYETEYDAPCADCGDAFKLPYEPITDMPVYCPKCTIKNNDMGKSKYFIELIVYLADKLNLKSGSELYGLRSPIKLGNVYYIFLSEKGVKKPGIICTTTWTPKDPLRLVDRETNEPTAIVRISTRDSNIGELVNWFVKENGIEAIIPNIPLKRF